MKLILQYRVVFTVNNSMPELVKSSPPYSPFRSENEESSPSSHLSEPSSPPGRVVALRYVQVDGARDENPSDEAFSQVGRSSSADATCVERSTSEEGPSIHQGNASSWAYTSTQTEQNIKELIPEPQAVVHASENSFGSLVVNLPGDRSDTPRKPSTSNPFTQYAGRGSIDAMQNRNTDYSEAKLQEAYVSPLQITSTTSDATDLQSLREHRDSERKFSALQEATKGRGAGLSDITNVRKTKAKKQDDESKAQRRTSQTRRAENKDEMTAASGERHT